MRQKVPQERVRSGVLTAIAVAATMVAGLSENGRAAAADEVSMLTSWFAQAEHGGFYQAKATGIYEKYGLDVEIKMGGPQINGMQILGAGQTDFLMSYDFSVLKALEAGIPAVTVATSFQFDLQGLITHPDVTDLADLRDKTIFVATAGRSSWWPWIKNEYGLSDEQTKTYTFNLQPFLADKNAAQQAYMSSEPYAAQKEGHDVNFFLFADYGFPPYGTTIVTTHDLVEKNPDLVQRFVRASLEGWISYFENPEPANKLIKEANPNMTDGQIAYAIERLREQGALTRGDAATMGVGIMTDERWQKTYDYMVSAGLLDPSVDVRDAYTTQFVKDLRLLP
jgi:NitT/TauT family transport system substrate-binding protein